MAQAGISPASLNLIEHNRRRVGAAILSRLATALGTDPMALTAAALLEGLSAAATDAGLAELDRIQDCAGRFPGWAALLAETHRRAEGFFPRGSGVE